MPKFVVRLYVDKVATCVVYANNEEEAKKVAFDWSNICDEETESEEIKDVEILGVEK